jgi:(p)ppGpp synthase/HD superfamily hydrolase
VADSRDVDTPGGTGRTELRLAIGDRSGALAEVISLLGNLDVNIYELEISRDGSVLMLEIDAKDHEVFSRVLSPIGSPKHS